MLPTLAASPHSSNRDRGKRAASADLERAHGSRVANVPPNSDPELRQDGPPKMVAIDHEIVVDTDEDDRRLALLDMNIRKFGTMSNTVAAAIRLEGVMKRRSDR